MNDLDKRGAHSHFKKDIDGKFVPKMSYDTERDALTVARFLNTKPNVIHKKVIYKCMQCGKWHIGSSTKIITDKDREHAKKELEKTNYRATGKVTLI